MECFIVLTSALALFLLWILGFFFVLAGSKVFHLLYPWVYLWVVAMGQLQDTFGGEISLNLTFGCVWWWADNKLIYFISIQNLFQLFGLSERRG